MHVLRRLEKTSFARQLVAITRKCESIRMRRVPQMRQCRLHGAPNRPGRNGWLRSWRTTQKPSRTGICKSRNTTSGGSRWMRSRASRPFVTPPRGATRPPIECPCAGAQTAGPQMRRHCRQRKLWPAKKCLGRPLWNFPTHKSQSTQQRHIEGFSSYPLFSAGSRSHVSRCSTGQPGSASRLPTSTSCLLQVAENTSACRNVISRTSAAIMLRVKPVAFSSEN